MQKSDIGLIGLAVMGENMAINMESKGYQVSVFNRTPERIENFLSGRARGKNIVGASCLQELVNQLKSPRIIILMIKAGDAVDQQMDALLPLLSRGDIIIDGGNSLFQDTIRRVGQLEKQGIYFIGMGVSGGEEGALLGPSLMPGGSSRAWPHVKAIFTEISARADDGLPCCSWMGPEGAGHFVKMVHNGIEYGDMQLISESYHLMKRMLGMDNRDMHLVFDEWNRTDLASYLIEITSDILNYQDKEGRYVIDRILDSSGQKGTGRWTAVTALNEGIPLTLITEAVFSRSLSSLKEERRQASAILQGPPVRKFDGDRTSMLIFLKDALYASKIISYAQGFALLRSVSDTYRWSLNFGDIALIWRGGCIIRSRFLGKIKEAYERNPKLLNLMLDPYFQKELARSQEGLRLVCAEALLHGIPIPSMSAALSYYDGYRTERLPANLIQAQRDYFGAHTYERIDRPRGEFFHTDWTGKGGTTASSTYDA